MADFAIRDSGTIVQVVAESQDAKDWIEENVEAPSYMWNGVVLNIEHRFAEAIIEGMIDSGLSPE
ncbi:hypothetical protein [Erythrobacter phage vB_EliS-L02]|nr:hypothetical protein [Erythrobacter phage vB_EliS-L02]